MKKFAIRLGWTCAASCLLLSVGCQDSQARKEPRTAPGALPSQATSSACSNAASSRHSGNLRCSSAGAARGQIGIGRTCRFTADCWHAACGGEALAFP